MKKLIFVLGLLLCSIAANGQTYKMEKVFSDKLNQVFISHLSSLDDPTAPENGKFSLWGFQRYDESWIIAYEVEYFKGDARQMHEFLSKISEFATKYEDQDKILTYISGVKVRTDNNIAGKFTLIYDKEQKVVSPYKAKKWAELLDSFVKFCKENKIVYYGTGS